MGNLTVLPRSLRLSGGSPSRRAHPDRTPLTEPRAKAKSGQDAPKLRLRSIAADAIGAVSLLVTLVGLLWIAEGLS